MIAELGYFTLIVATLLAIIQLIIPMMGAYRDKKSWMQLARPLSLGVCFLLSLSFLCLLYAFVQDDFSVAYVAQHSNTNLDFQYKISAIWAGHEGSILLWTWILSFWTVLFSMRSRIIPLSVSSKALSILSFLMLGFLIFLLGLSNPFARILPDFPIDGSDLNPLLQDPGLMIHPPMLYLGYIGFAIPFAMSLALLLSLKKIDLPMSVASSQEVTAIVIKGMRPWVLLAWSFLALGIALGSWWAYYELGWGGWWFWDPVENASLMPWLIGTALIHSLMLSDKRKLYYKWSLCLAILGFVFSLLGTFLVRSGLLSSVHAFANDPKRGLYLFLFVCLVLALSFSIFISRVSILKYLDNETEVEQVNSKSFQVIPLVSRESFILFSTILLLVATLTILLGTLFPLILDSLTGQKISVGFPYFNTVFVPLILPVLFFIPLGPLSFWGENKLSHLWKILRFGFLLSLLVSLIIVLVLFYFYPNVLPIPVFIGLFLASWIILGTLKFALLKIKKSGSVFKLSGGALGMILAHAGIGISIIGITLVSFYQLEKEVKIALKESVNIGSYQIQFADIKGIEGANYVGYQAHFKAVNNSSSNKNSVIDKFSTPTVVNLYPEKRTFVIQELTMTEMAIDWGWFRDLDIALGEKLDKDHWSVRIYYKPFIRWIWFGALMMALGGLCASYGRSDFKHSIRKK